MEWTAMEYLLKCNTYFNQIKHFISQSLSQCDLCGSNVQNHLLLCDACFSDLPRFNQAIIQSDLLNWPAINRGLPDIYFDHLFCLSPYLAPFTQWLPQFKYQGRFELSTLFVDLLYQQWQKVDTQHTAVDLVLSVPLHINKWQGRGYNQAHLIAKKFANKIAVPYQSSTLKRIKQNDSQVGQTGKQRRRNLANAFMLAEPLSENIKHVVLIDDVVTTGSTASEISKILKKAGISTVTLVTLCLTLPTV